MERVNTVKKAWSILYWVAGLMALLLPVGSLYSLISRFNHFYLVNYNAYTIALAAVFLIAAVWAAFIRDRETGTVMAVLTAVLPVLLMISWFLMLTEGQSGMIGHISMATGVICSCYVAVRFVKYEALFTATAFISALLMILIAGLSILGMFQLRYETVVKTLESPSGKFYVEVVDCDQGALGGSTVVYVHERGLNTFLFCTETSWKFYEGQWRAYENMDIHWEEDDVLFIDDMEIFFGAGGLSDCGRWLEE